MDMTLLRSGKFEFGFKKCGAADWTAVGIFILAMIVIVYVGVRMSAKE